MAVAARSVSNNETGNLIVATNDQLARSKTWSMSSSNYGSTSVARVNAPAKSNSLPYRSPNVNNGGGGGYGGTPAATRPVGGDQRLIDKPVLPTSSADSHSRLQNFAPAPKTFSNSEFNKKIVTSSADQGWLDTFGDTGFASTNDPGDAIDNISQVISNNSSFGASGGSKQNIAPVTAKKSLLNAGVSSEKPGNRRQPNISTPKLPGNTGKNLSVAESDPQNFFGPIPNSIYPDINQHAPTNQLTRYHPSGTVNPDHSKPANFAPVIIFKPDSIHYVSEPSVLAIFGLGLAGLGIIFRRAV
ncbi:PEP-CTERM sorting domain-containing protein [Nitrosomonas sp. Nm51]|uniref:PEP-CTERM sorting domain-containing protein n=1 Tax=Nitrosomonas sp. Nm51 TaxID=133720 RepID=UPI00115F898C|nr:PEP-CTERM sorting domain-containing protein [Nitrosomonas sp. Nm51]